MITFNEWLKKKMQSEMAGTGAIYDGSKSPDFNWWGAPESMGKPNQPAHKKHHKKHKKDKE